MLNSGMLLIAHQGLSFCVEIYTKLNELGIETYIVSSKFGDSAPLNKIRNKIHWLYISDNANLSEEEVLNSLDMLKKDNKHVLACIATMEGYRALCAKINNIVGATDCPDSAILLATDKYLCRKTLYEASCSKVKIEIVTEELFNAYQSNNIKKFIKPRRGAASFGAFRLKPSTTYQDILYIQEQMQNDTFIQSIFRDSHDFVIEDELDGTEYSVEVASYNKKVYIVACHCKNLTHENMTVLEDQFFSPAGLSEAELKELSVYLNQCLNVLGLNEGIFHVEIRKSTNGWDIVEVNPRIGGVMVNDSVRIRTGGQSILDLWVYILLSKEERLGTKDLFMKTVPRFEENNAAGNFQENEGTFQQVIYGRPGKIVESIVRNNLELKPYIESMSIKVGDKIPDSDREHFIGCVLWKFPLSEYDKFIGILTKEAPNLYTIEYSK